MAGRLHNGIVEFLFLFVGKRHLDMKIPFFEVSDDS